MSENLHIAITGDNQNFLNALSEARENVRRTADTVERSGMDIEDVFKRIAAAAGIAFSLAGAKEFASKVAQVRGEFQQLEIAFSTMLGSSSKASSLMQQLVHTAAITPFDLKGVADGAKQLLAYGTQAEDVNETLTRLGDIASGLSIPLGDLVYLYGTTMTQGRMFTQDLRQFMGRGIPLAEELANQLGVTKDKVGELVTAGKVGAEEVKKAIWSMTDEGSKFGGLMEAQSKSITGQIANIEDAIDVMLNNIGQEHEGIINGVLTGVGSLVENYERVGQVIAGVVAVYGTYKAAVMTVTAVQALQAAGVGALSTAEAVHYGWLVLCQKAQALLNKTMLANPYVLAATAVAALVVALVSMHDGTSAAEKAAKSLDKTMEDLTETQQKYRDETEKAVKTAQDDTAATLDREGAMQLLISRYPDIIKEYIDEKGHLRDILQLKKDIAEFDGKRQREETTETLKNEGLSAWDLYNKLSVYSKIQTNGGTFTEQERDKIEAIRDAYKDETGKSWYESASLTDMRDYYREKASQARTRYNRNLTENKIYDFTAEGGSLEGYTDEQLKALQKTLRDAQTESYKKTSVWVGDLKDYLTYDDRKDLLTRIEGMIDARGQEKYTASERLENLKKDMDDAKKALADFDKSSDKYTANEADKKRKELSDAVDAAEKAYKGFGGTVKTSEQQTKESDKRIKAQEELGEKLKSLQQKNNEEEVSLMKDGTDKKLQEIRNDYDKRIAEIDNQEADFKKKNKEAGRSEGLTSEQSDALKKARDLAKQDYDKQTADVLKEGLSAMRDYLKEFGSFYQKKLSIAEEYEEKIAKASTDGEKLSLQKERDKRMGSVEYEAIAADIDWKALFSGVGTLSKEMMQPMMDKLQAYTKTDAYLNADSQTQQDVVTLIQELRQYLGTDHSVTWESLGQATMDFKAAVEAYNQAVIGERSAVQKLEQAKNDLKAGKITQDAFDAVKADADSFGKATQDARDNMQKLATTLNDTSEEVTNFTSKLSIALNNAKGWSGVSGFSEVKGAVANIDSLKGVLDSVLPSMGEGVGKTIGAELSPVLDKSLGSLGSGLESVMGSAMGQIVGFVAQIPQLILSLVSTVKNMVTGALDALTELVSLRWIDDLVISVCDALVNLTDAIFDLPENLLKVLKGVVVDGVLNLANTFWGRVGNILSFGALSSDGPSSWFTNSNASKVAKTLERLTDENETLEKAVENLTEELEKHRGKEAIDISQQATELQKQVNENALAKVKAQAGYHSAHHSWNAYWNGFTDEQVQRLSKQIGRDWNGDIWDLSPEEAKWLQSNVDMWEKIKDTGKGDYGDRVAEKLEEYIEQAGKLEEITDSLNETLTTTTEEDVFDNFLSSLHDLANGSEDVFDEIADSWQEMVNKMVVNNIVGAKFQEKMKAWYEKLADLNKAKTGNEVHMTDEQYRSALDGLKTEYENYVKDAQSEIELLRNSGIIKSTEEYTQEASTKGFQSMSQDTGEELNGRFTALQISGDTIARQTEQMYGQMMAMTAIQTSSNNALLEIRDLMVYNNSFLEDMVRYSKKMYTEFGDNIKTITDKMKTL